MIQGHTLLLRIRLAVLTLALASGLFFSIYFNYRYLTFANDVATETLTYVVAALYSYELWGPKFLVHVYLYVRSLVILALTAGWLYLILSDLLYIDSGLRLVFGCFVEDKICHAIRTSQVFGLVAALLMMVEVGLTIKVGPVDSNAAKGQEEGKEGGEQGQNRTVAMQQHPAPILVSDQHYQQHLQQQQRQQQQQQQQFQQQEFQQQPFQQQLQNQQPYFQQPQQFQQQQFQQQPQVQQPYFQQPQQFHQQPQFQQQFSMTYVQPQTITPQPQSLPAPVMNLSARPQPEGTVTSTSP